MDQISREQAQFLKSRVIELNNYLAEIDRKVLSARNTFIHTPKLMTLMDKIMQVHDYLISDGDKVIRPEDVPILVAAVELYDATYGERIRGSMEENMSDEDSSIQFGKVLQEIQFYVNLAVV